MTPVPGLCTEKLGGREPFGSWVTSHLWVVLSFLSTAINDRLKEKTLRFTVYEDEKL